MKKCTKCGLEKEPDQFGLARGKPRARCLRCIREDGRRYYQEHLGSRREDCREYFKENREARQKYGRGYYKEHSADRCRAAKKWQKEHPEKTTAHRWKAKLKQYGITTIQYQNIERSQGGVCAICGGSNPSGRALAVDHSHRTGVIRGLLCSRCNTGLGLFNDSAERLLEAAIYRESWGG
jgi:Recombination endonuclease VII